MATSYSTEDVFVSSWNWNWKDMKNVPTFVPWNGKLNKRKGRNHLLILDIFYLIFFFLISFSVAMFANCGISVQEWPNELSITSVYHFS